MKHFLSLCILACLVMPACYQKKEINPLTQIKPVGEVNRDFTWKVKQQSVKVIFSRSTDTDDKNTTLKVQWFNDKEKTCLESVHHTKPFTERNPIPDELLSEQTQNYMALRSLATQPCPYAAPTSDAILISPVIFFNLKNRYPKEYQHGSPLDYHYSYSRGETISTYVQDDKMPYQVNYGTRHLTISTLSQQRLFPLINLDTEEIDGIEFWVGNFKGAIEEITPDTLDPLKIHFNPFFLDDEDSTWWKPHAISICFADALLGDRVRILKKLNLSYSSSPVTDAYQMYLKNKSQFKNITPWADKCF